MIPLLLLVGAAHAAPADWTNYLCKYGPTETTQLVRVNEHDGRVTVNDRDMDAVKISDDRIAFNPPRGGLWVIRKKTHALETLSYTPVAKFENGTCKIVSD